jgi:hypothetical protein
MLDAAACPHLGWLIRRAGLLIAVIAVLLGLLPASAQAAAKSATCATLQTVLDGAADTDVITLDSTDGPGGLCSGPYTLKAFPVQVLGGDYVTWTLTGNSADGHLDGFDRNEVDGRALTGHNVHRLEIQDLTFRDGRSTTDGGAIAIDGQSSLGLRTSTFFNNRATGKGGAVFFSEDAAPGLSAGFGMSGNTFGVQGDATQRNQADVGGAVAVETHRTNANSGVNGSLFYGNVAAKTGGGYDYLVEAGQGENTSTSGNVFDGNKAGGGGGGAHIKGNNMGTTSVDGANTFQNNTVDPSLTGAPAGAHYGGGLWLEIDHTGGYHRGNSFVNNHVLAATPATDSGGGGEAVTGPDTPGANAPRFIQNNTYTGNTLPAAGASTDSEGGGLFVEGPGITWHSWLTVIAGNSIGAGGEGGGAYAGAPAGNTTLQFADSTIAGNSVGAGGQYPGLAGGGDDRLALHNTIVWNPPHPDIGGFSALSGDLDIQYSDACNASLGPLISGFGNICADPLLVNAPGGNIHETPASPTIDKGNDDLFLGEEEFPCCDFEGDPRPTDGDGDGHTVDMGADESPAFVPPPPPPPEQCHDGKDNDGDGAIDLADPGCASAADNNEGDESLNALLLCGTRVISLVRADAVGKKAVLTGVVAAKYAGQKVAIYANYPAKGGLKQVASVKASASGNFKASLKLPSKRRFNKARFQARITGKKSATLKLPQSLASSSVKQAAAQLVLKGTVKKALLGKRNAVIVRRLTCGHYTKVGEAKPDKKGKYVVRFPAPAGSTAALYRAETRTLNKPRGKKYVKQYARAIGITLTK